MRECRNKGKIVKKQCHDAAGTYITMWYVSLGSTSVIVVQSSCCVDSLWPHGLQYTRPPCPPPSSGVCPSSCPLHRWCLPTISSSVTPSFPALNLAQSRSFPMSWFFAWGGQSIGASASVLPVNIQDWSPLGWTDLISLQSKELSRAFSSTTVWKHQFFGALPSLWSSSHNCRWLLERP